MCECECEWPYSDELDAVAVLEECALLGPLGFPVEEVGDGVEADEVEMTDDVVL